MRANYRMNATVRMLPMSQKERARKIFVIQNSALKKKN